MSGRIERGTCSACGTAAERGPSGAWWHVAESCHGSPHRDGIPASPARFQPERQQQTAPRDRQLRHPGRDR